ncbi:UPAR/Ly6 domain-containing protein cold [Diabrotica undecimpunctata]|uniref:UPAR/Ly6 domain-containing protein cold n=1 Tax=Diabrotica undecimpunctata TaxID=50387 RepID=UPI003B63FEA7
MTTISVVLATFLLITQLKLGVSLECYVCDNQENNKEKCVTTIQTCNYGEDVCLTEISWGSTPYWQQGALKQYYISKRCSSKDKCAKFRSSNMGTCTHIWYQDWKCSECCKGDRCNYYIISGSAKKNPVNLLTLLMASILSILLFTHLH